MAKAKSKFKDASEEVIQKNLLVQDPEGLPAATAPDENTIVIAKEIPEMRRVQFMNQRDPGHALMFHYHSATHPLKHYTLQHGKEYDLSVEVILHLEDCNEKIYGYRKGDDGHPEMYIKSLKYVFSCKAARKKAA
jgi:uncharacterized protein YtpQ (UPF0354 family)